MEGKRNYGEMSVGEDALFNLEKYSNSTLAAATEIQSNLDSIIAASLDLAPDTRAASRIWGFKKDPWQFYSESGQLLFSLENIRITVVKAIDLSHGLRGLMILRLDWTTFSDDEFAGKIEIPTFIHATDGDGETLVTWDLGQLRPTADWVRRPVSFMQDFDPRIYDNISGAELCLCMFNNRLYEC